MSANIPEGQPTTRDLGVIIAGGKFSRRHQVENAFRSKAWNQQEVFKMDNLFTTTLGNAWKVVNFLTNHIHNHRPSAIAFVLGYLNTEEEEIIAENTLLPAIKQWKGRVLFFLDAARRSNSLPSLAERIIDDPELGENEFEGIYLRDQVILNQAAPRLMGPNAVAQTVLRTVQDRFSLAIPTSSETVTIQATRAT